MMSDRLKTFGVTLVVVPMAFVALFIVAIMLLYLPIQALISPEKLTYIWKDSKE